MIAAILDGSGVHGSVFHYTVFFTLMACTLLVFIYFWWKGRLDLDEAAKLQMMKTNDQEIEGDDHDH